MTESGEHASRAPIRASNAERDAVEALLQHHFAVGRLTLAELEERAAAAYEARTREQLDALVRDLPGEAEEAGRPQGDVVDSRLLIILLCCAPPAALVYWLVSQRGARRRRADPPVRQPRASGEIEGPGAL